MLRVGIYGASFADPGEGMTLGHGDLGMVLARDQRSEDAQMRRTRLTSSSAETGWIA
jgi:hypothetical protein